MDNDTYVIVFEKLHDAASAAEGASADALREEIEEIAELRKMVLEITEPPPVSYTTG